MTSLKIYNEPVTTTCGHHFCKSCIEKEIAQNNACPTCQKLLTTQQLNITDLLTNIVKEFKNARAEYERTNEVNLSQESILNISSIEKEEEEETSAMEIDCKLNTYYANNNKMLTLYCKAVETSVNSNTGTVFFIILLCF